MSSAPDIKVRPSAQDIWRTAITPRWLIALIALIAFIAVCIVLGRWQWDRTQDILAAERSAASEPISLTELINDDGTWGNAEIGRTVILDGTFTGDEVLITNREYEGEAGTWTITRFELDDQRKHRGGSRLVAERDNESTHPTRTHPHRRCAASERGVLRRRE